MSLDGTFTVGGGGGDRVVGRGVAGALVGARVVTGTGAAVGDGGKYSFSSFLVEGAGADVGGGRVEGAGRG